MPSLRLELSGCMLNAKTIGFSLLCTPGCWSDAKVCTVHIMKTEVSNSVIEATLCKTSELFV